MNMNAPQETPTLKPSRRFCVAPMMDWKVELYFYI